VGRASDTNKQTAWIRGTPGLKDIWAWGLPQKEAKVGKSEQPKRGVPSEESAGAGRREVVKLAYGPAEVRSLSFSAAEREGLQEKDYRGELHGKHQRPN